MVPRNVAWAGGNGGSGATPLAELFPLNACVRATVKTISHGALALSLKPSFVHPSAAAASRGDPPTQPTPRTHLTLGRVTEKEMHALLTAAPPPEHALVAPPPRELSYLSTLARNPIFSSPDCTRAMTTAYGIRLVRTAATQRRVIWGDASAVVLSREGGRVRALQESTSVSSAWSAMHRGDVEVYAKAVRKELYHRWAQETTRQGVTLAKAGQYNEALKLYRQALEFDSKHRDAYVVRVPRRRPLSSPHEGGAERDALACAGARRGVREPGLTGQGGGGLRDGAEHRPRRRQCRQVPSRHPSQARAHRPSPPVGGAAARVSVGQSWQWRYGEHWGGGGGGGGASATSSCAERGPAGAGFGAGAGVGRGGRTRQAQTQTEQGEEEIQAQGACAETSDALRFAPARGSGTFRG